MWCCIRGLPLDVPFIILSHMHSLLTKQFSELPYGMIITLLARPHNIDVSDCEIIHPTPQGNYDARLFSVLKSGKAEEDPEEEVVPTTKKGRKKTAGLVRGKKAANSPTRKSGRLTDKGKETTSVAISSEDDSSKEEDQPLLMTQPEEDVLSEPEEVFEDAPMEDLPEDFGHSPFDKPLPTGVEIGGTSAPGIGTHSSSNLSTMFMAEQTDILKQIRNFIMDMRADMKILIADRDAGPSRRPSPIPPPAAAIDPITQIANAAAAAALEEEEDEANPALP